MMYSNLPNFVLGFHGCDKLVSERILMHQDVMKLSDNEYDWLGPGIYFWENNPQRAIEFAQMLKDKPDRARVSVNEPASLGAVVDLGHCLNLLEQTSLDVLKRGYEILKIKMEKLGTPMPENKRGSKSESKDLLLRFLDCAVIQAVHEYNRETEKRLTTPFGVCFLKGMIFIPVQDFKKKIIFRLQ